MLIPSDHALALKPCSLPQIYALATKKSIVLHQAPFPFNKHCGEDCGPQKPLLLDRAHF